MTNEVDRNHGTVVQAHEIGCLHVAAHPLSALNGLPPSVSSFTGRVADLAELTAHRVVVVSGLGGVGKTELVLRFAEDNSFPGGQLLWDFHSYDAGRTDAGAALRSFLLALGVGDIPEVEADKARLFRSLVSNREPMLFVLDNVGTAAQVRPLLVPRHKLIVTSRDLLPALDAHQLELTALPVEDAERVTGDAEVARLCDGLPLALQIMAALKRSDPDHDWAADLRGRRLNVLKLDDQDLRATFDLSYRTLSDDQRRFFRLLSLAGSFVTPDSAAAVCALTGPEILARLRDLRNKHLLESGNRFHDLVLQYAVERREAEETRSTIEEAADRYDLHLQELRRRRGHWRRIGELAECYTSGNLPRYMM
ncbi:hypothetical protein [Lentzea sp. NPDC060358]|uniref:hypothetical protein n=1 Tax=Lentzea sp. NPDC060358 TaxID=3347103 RepID=UPI00365A010B